MVCDNGRLGSRFSCTPGTSCKNGTTFGSFLVFSFPTSLFYPQNNNRDIRWFIFTFSIYFEHSSSILLSIEEKNVFCQPALLPHFKKENPSPNIKHFQDFMVLVMSQLNLYPIFSILWYTMLFSDLPTLISMWVLLYTY